MPLTVDLAAADKVINNNRYKQLRFEADQDCTVHGLGGYFESVLYKDVMISIHPRSHSPGMFSWFPIFFPIRVSTYCSCSPTP